jgi:hypothetical protein
MTPSEPRQGYRFFACGNCHFIVHKVDMSNNY